ncbi:EpsG family protein [Aerococcaceae bacterium zg-ZUI334]|uniref:EpsG family protein n=1 Tax=Aerococcaceae bacterium zg-252 TaxID=2796928 RepID=UPI001B986AE5|nr:EpsG family protein [Aerococcaceae bacterium zg-ZUI334]
MFFYLSLYIFFAAIAIVNRNMHIESVNVKLRIGNISISLKNLMFWILSTLLIALSCFRYGIGTDYFHYKNAYDGTMPWWISIDERLLFKWLMQLFNALHLPFQVFIIFFSLLSLILLFKMVESESSNPYFSVAVFLGLSIYSFSFNSFRQFAAIVVLIYAFYTLKKKRKLLNFIFFVLVSIGLHMSALLAAIVWLVIDYWKPKLFHFRMFMFGAVVLLPITWISLNYVNKVLLFLIHFTGHYSGYVNYERTAMAYRLLSSGITLYNLIFIFPVLSLIIYIMRDYFLGKYNLSDFQLLCLKVSFLCNFFYSFNLSSEMIDRMIFYFSILNIFLYPELIRYIRWKWGNFFAFIAILVLTMIVGYMFYRNLNFNIHEIIPYKTIFSR